MATIRVTVNAKHNPSLGPTGPAWLCICASQRIDSVSTIFRFRIRGRKSWGETQGHEAVAEFVEGGASGTDDKRPVFQQMIERACDGDNAFDVIAVHSHSRFFRDAFGQEFYLRKLAKQGVKLVSITQPLGDDADPAQAMMRKVIALFDEYQSKENAKHVLRGIEPLFQP